MTDPAVSTIQSHHNTTAILSRAKAGKGIYPVVDPMRSSGKRNDRQWLGARQYSVADGVREHLVRYHEREGVITMPGIEELPEKDGRIVLRSRRLQRYLTQPLQLSASHAGIPGTFAPLGDCLGHREAFLLGQDDVPEAPRYGRSTRQKGMP